jgi:hypothetical protein
MTMHLAHPALTTMGKRKGKVKFRNADEARKARELADAWAQKQTEWASASKPARQSRPLTRPFPKLGPPPGRTMNDHIPSLDTGVKGAVNVRAIPKYTGDKIIGIGTMHKSNAVPIFSGEQAVDISKMRRG